jgi:hypothetical protein
MKFWRDGKLIPHRTAGALHERVKGIRVEEAQLLGVMAGKHNWGGRLKGHLRSAVGTKEHAHLWKIRRYYIISPSFL